MKRNMLLTGLDIRFINVTHWKPAVFHQVPSGSGSQHIFFPSKRPQRSDVFQIRWIRFTCPSGAEPTEGVWNIHLKCDWTYILFITSRADQSGPFLSFSRGFLLVGGDTGRATKLFLKPVGKKTSFQPRKAFAVVLCSTFSCEDAL